MGATRALGTSFMFGAATVGSLTSIGGIDSSAEQIDVTALDSTGGYREFLAGFKDAGEVALSGFFDPDDAGQTALWAAYGTGATTDCKIVFPASLTTQWEFDAVVIGFSTSAELEDAIGFECTLKVSGQPTLNTAVV